MSSKSKGAGISLNECFDQFLRPEKIEGWKCTKCKEPRTALRRQNIWSLPDVLIIHLIRFQYTAFSREKLKVNVDFPLEEMDLTEKVLNSVKSSSIIDPN